MNCKDLFSVSNSQKDSNSFQNFDAKLCFYKFIEKTGQRDNDGAMLYINRAIELEPSSAFYFYHRGLLKFQIGEHNNAIEDFNKAIQFGIFYDKKFFDSAMNSFFKKDFDDADWNFRKAIVTPIYTKVDYNTAIEKFRNKDYNAAIQDFNKVLELNNSDFESYYLRAVSYFLLHNYSSALSDFNEAIKLKPSISEAYYYRGKTNFVLKNFDSAISDFDKAVALNMTDADIFYFRGLSKLLLGKKEDAHNDLTKSANLGFDAARKSLEENFQ